MIKFIRIINDYDLIATPISFGCLIAALCWVYCL